MKSTGARPDEPDSSPEPSQRSRRRLRMALRLAIGLALYVLSIGPLFWQWYEAENMGGWPFLRMFYFPLRLACGIKIVEEFVNNYINWWIS